MTDSDLGGIRAAAPEVESVALRGLLVDDTFQVRKALDHETVRRYEQRYREGCTFPPIKVGRIRPATYERPKSPLPFDDLHDGTLVVLDGFHRVCAAKRAGLTELPAFVTEVQPRDALWEAARSNLANGLPLKRGELFRVLDAYVKAKKWRAEPGSGRRYKTYKQIAADLDHVIPYRTVHRWIERNYPWLHKLMGRGDLDNTARKEPDQPSPLDEALANYIDALQALAKLAPSLSPDQRGEAFAATQECASTLTQLGYREPDF